MPNKFPEIDTILRPNTPAFQRMFRLPVEPESVTDLAEQRYNYLATNKRDLNPASDTISYFKMFREYEQIPQGLQKLLINAPKVIFCAGYRYGCSLKEEASNPDDLKIKESNIDKLVEKVCLSMQEMCYLTNDDHHPMKGWLNYKEVERWSDNLKSFANFSVKQGELAKLHENAVLNPV